MKFRRRSFDGFEIAYIDCSGRSFAKHTHDEFVISANVVGREQIWLDGKDHEAETDELTLYNPGQLQASEARHGPWAFFSLYVEPAWLERHLGSARAVAFERPVIRAETHTQAISQFAHAALADEIDDATVIESALLVLGLLVEHHGAGQPSLARHAASAEMARVRSRLLDDIGTTPSVTELAALVDLSPVQLIRAFARAYGLPPHQWLTMHRLMEVRRILRRGHAPLATLALDLGFADQAHFTRRFAATYGVTPAAFARG